MTLTAARNLTGFFYANKRRRRSLRMLHSSVQCKRTLGGEERSHSDRSFTSEYLLFVAVGFRGPVE